MKISISIAILVLFGTSSFSQKIAQWRGANRDGIYNESGLLKKWPDNGPKLLWHFDSLGAGHASAAVTDDKVFTSGVDKGNGFVIAFDYNGKMLWKTIYGKEWMENWDGVRSTPLIYNGKAYIMSGYGKITCLDAENGKIIWTVDVMTEYNGRNIKWGVTENLLIDDNKLFCTVGGIEANVIALDKETGKLIWKSKGKGEKSAYCSPTMIMHKGKKIFVTVTESAIMGIDPANGNVLWSYEQPNKWSVHANTPLYYNGYLYHTCGYEKGGVMLIIADNGLSATKVWSNSTLDNKMGGIVLIDGRIYGSGDVKNSWFCIDWKTGNDLFSSNMMKKGNIISAEGLLYCYGEEGKVALVEPKADTFNMISSFSVPYGAAQHWAHLVIHNKKLYVRHGTSLMVYSIAAE